MSSILSNQFSVVLPCYNPSLNWVQIIVINYNLIKTKYPNDFAELIIVNDGSTHNCPSHELDELLNNNPDIKFIHYSKNMGKGYALREAIRQSKSNLVIYTDIDFPYTFESFENIYKALCSGAQLSIGFRNDSYYSNLPKTRVIISKFLRFLIKKLLRIPTNDTQCGLKGLNQDGKEVFLKTSINRYLFDLEFIFLSARKRLNIQTVPVELRPGIQLSSMNWKILIQESGNFARIFINSLLG
jgi:glycosyltransferase involved in cell wall biosynthesis